MELNSEQLLTQVVKNSWDRRFGEDIGDLDAPARPVAVNIPTLYV